MMSAVNLFSVVHVLHDFVRRESVRVSEQAGVIVKSLWLEK